MNTAQKLLVRESFAKLLPISAQAGVLFYRNLFALDPALKPLFSTDISLQAAKLMQMLHAAINLLDRMENLLPLVRQLAIRHVRYGVVESHYKTVGLALIDTLSEGLGDGFDTETRTAWEALYTLLSEAMIAAAYSCAEAPA